MLRFGRQIKVRGRPFNHDKFQILQRSRQMSTTGVNGGGAAKSLLVGSGIVVAGGAATVGLAWMVPSMRSSIENSVPYTHFLFDPFLGPLTPIENTDPFETPLGKIKKPKQSAKAEIPANKDVLETSKLRTREPEVPVTIPLPVPEPLQETLTQDTPPQTPAKTDTLEQESLAPESTKPDLEKPELTLSPENKEISKAEPAAVTPNVTGASETNYSEQATEPVEAEAPAEAPSLERPPEVVHDRIIKLEEDVKAECAAISSIIDETLSSAADRCAKAMESSNEASKAIALHLALLREALDETQGSSDDRRERWTSVSRVLEQKSRLQIEAESAYQQAKKELTKLKSVIDQAKDMNKSEMSKKVIEAEQNFADMYKEMESAVREVNMKLYESHVMSQYKDLMDVSKEQFRNELLSTMSESQGGTLSSDDLNVIVSHAQRRVDQLQRELAEERVISAKKMELAVRVAREQWEAQTEIDVEKRIEELKRETEIEQDKRMEEARDAFEGEMRIQLKRQAAAHTEHLADMLAAQERDLKQQMNEEFQKTLTEQEQQFDEKMEEIKNNYENQIHELTEQFQFELNKAMSRVTGIEMAIDGRAHIENESRRAQEIWLGCEALRIALQYGGIGKPIPLGAELDALKQVNGVDQAMLDVIDTFPGRAGERGVFTEESLRVSYKHVSKLCRRLSMVDETRNSLFTYILSYLKSFLIINRAQNEPPSDLDVDKLDTFNTLSYATYCLEQGDLEQAARFMNKLTGEPRRVADGWLKEARLYLETRQTIRALSALASAISIAANLEL